MLCDQEIGNREAYNAGALGSVLYDFRRVDDFSLIFSLAAMTLHLEEYGAIISYMNVTRLRFFWDTDKGIFSTCFDFIKLLMLSLLLL